MSALRSQTLTLLAKDLKLEWRAKARLVAVAVFGLLSLVVFSIAVGPDSKALTAGAAGFLVIALLLSSTLALAESFRVEQEARSLGIPLATLDEQPAIDITIDGADEVDPNLDVIKGGGGALLREKLVAQASRRMVVIVDESKLSAQLGTKFYVPVEVVTFGWESQARFLQTLGAVVKLRVKEGNPFVTDQGNYILDCTFGPIANAAQLAQQLKQRTGIVDSGLFIGLVTDLIVANASDGFGEQ